MKLKFPKVGSDFGAGCIAVFAATTLEAMFFGALSLSTTGFMANAMMGLGLGMCTIAMVTLVAGLLFLID